PILETSERVIQGSSDIIDWAETQSRAKGLSYTLFPERLDSEYLAMAQRLDDKLGCMLDVVTIAKAWLNTQRRCYLFSPKTLA
ncbi:MAG: hypothetical protein ACI9LU_002427, partial [Polaribacter sp.]